MTIILALRAREPSELIRPMIEHHLAQGIDRIFITFDVPQTAPLDCISRAEWNGRVTVGPEPQIADLTDGDWLLYAAADEFWLCASGTLTVAAALTDDSHPDPEVVPPVIDLTGYSSAERKPPRAVRVGGGAGEGTSASSTFDVVRVPASSAATSAHIASLESTVRLYASRRIVRALDNASRAAGKCRRLIPGLRRLAKDVPGALRRTRLARAQARRYRAMRRLVDSPIQPVSVAGSVRPDAIPLIMCLWNRPQRIEHIIGMLSAQREAPPIRLILWNNNPVDTERYRAAMEAHAPSGALSSIELYSSPRNVGGIARFVVAHHLWNHGVRGAFVMLDDDQNINDTFVHDLLSEYRDHSIRAWWAYRNEGSYWHRLEIEPGTVADYAGTGGTVADIEIAADRSFFDIDPRYLMLEDQWMTHYARQRDWDIRKAHVSLEQVLEETNQYHGLLPLKDEFYAFLRGLD